MVIPGYPTFPWQWRWSRYICLHLFAVIEHIPPCKVTKRPRIRIFQTEKFYYRRNLTFEDVPASKYPFQKEKIQQKEAASLKVQLQGAISSIRLVISPGKNFTKLYCWGCWRQFEQTIIPISSPVARCRIHRQCEGAICLFLVYRWWDQANISEAPYKELYDSTESSHGMISALLTHPQGQNSLMPYKFPTAIFSCYINLPPTSRLFDCSKGDRKKGLALWFLFIIAKPLPYTSRSKKKIERLVPKWWFFRWLYVVGWLVNIPVSTRNQKSFKHALLLASPPCELGISE